MSVPISEQTTYLYEYKEVSSAPTGNRRATALRQLVKYLGYSPPNPWRYKHGT